MNWQDILKEDLLEKVIAVLTPFYGSREEVFSSNILGVMHEENLKDSPFTYQDVIQLLRDMTVAGSYESVEHADKKGKMIAGLNRILRN